ncbi:ABC transporter transmembrane domain-containing protein, partial [Nocardia zapadnayensis]
MSDRQSPASIALASSQGRRALWQLGLIACVKALGLVLVAEGIARGVVGLIAGAPVTAAVLTGVLGALLRAAAVWASRTAGARAAIGVKTDLRAALVRRTFAGSTRDVPVSDGALTLAATRALDDLDDYFTAVLPALTGSAAIPLLIVARIAFSDWVSALIIVLTLPLVPVFMVLIGRYTADRIADATTALDRLSTVLVELARGLPVLVGLGRVLAQTRALRDTSETYRDTTMQTLRVAFLSALALEFISTISVALVAVFIGVRLVYGTMELSDGLFALILAPECYLPLRQLGAAFHSTENGMAAFARVRALIDRPVAAPATRPAEGTDGGIAIRRLSVHHAGRSRAALRALDARIPAPGLTVLHGPSGAGKSTLLGVLAGLVPRGRGLPDRRRGDRGARAPRARRAGPAHLRPDRRRGARPPRRDRRRPARRRRARPLPRDGGPRGRPEHP